MKKFGLIGFPLTHSFSKQYFSEKFQRENIQDCSYDNFELKNIEDLPALIRSYPELTGLNVTIPYKEAVLTYVGELGHYAKKINAVNVIRIEKNGVLKGFNSDYYGFRTSLEKWIGKKLNKLGALVLGTGGAAKAVLAVLHDCNINYRVVSRHESKADFTYNTFTDDPEIIYEFPLIINTTPIGMHPKVNEAPNLPYDLMDERFFLYDLIYNPEKTLFLQNGEQKGAHIKNGLEMLILQAEKSWEIWNK